MKTKSRIGFSEIGQRSKNEDYIAASDLPDSLYEIFIVCDGVGGAQKGDVASEMVSKELLRFLLAQNEIDEDALKAGIARTETLLNRYLEAHPYSNGMATTVTLAVIDETNMYFLHIGDSKILYVRDRKLAYASHDHSLVNDMVNTGLLTEQEALVHPKRNVITQAVAAGGNASNPEIKIMEKPIEGDQLLLCTDGVLESLSVEELVAILNTEDDDAVKAEEIKSRCASNSKDNYSGYLLRF